LSDAILLSVLQIRVTRMDETDKPILIYVTFPTLDLARSVGTSVVSARLAACVNILPGMQCIYRWQGQIEQAEEVVMVLKSRASLVDAVTAHVRALHPYDTPAIITLPITGGDPTFLAWMMAETDANTLAR
jgi:periplasmic divalent cation tolerance protein